MTLTLHLKPELEAGLIAQAQANGMDLEHYVLSLVERALPSGVLQSYSESGARAEAVRRMQEFGDKYHLSLGEPVTRAQLHEGHRF
jgi:hypothetical protein